jgi:hypothetical protein
LLAATSRDSQRQWLSVSAAIRGVSGFRLQPEGGCSLQPESTCCETDEAGIAARCGSQLGVLFQFSTFPLFHFMKTLARESDKAEILRRLREVRPESVRRWGRMSAHQMVCHLCDSFRMVTGEKPVGDANRLMQRTVVKWIALYAPLKWPPGIQTIAEVDQERGGTRPVEFAADLARVESLVECITADPALCEGKRHPYFGMMSRAAWLRWAYLHTDHHLRQFGS